MGYEELSAANPGLVYCSISGFGSSGPLAEVKADDALVMAKAGVLRDQPGWYGDGRRPVYRAPRDGRTSRRCSRSRESWRPSWSAT